MNLFPFASNHIGYQIENGKLFVDGKTILKSTFASAANFIQELSKNPNTITDGGRSPLWVPIATMAQFMAEKAHSTTIDGAIDYLGFQDAIFDYLYDNGNEQFVSERRKNQIANEKEAERIANANKVANLEKELATLRLANENRVAAERERAKATVNPVIRALNDVWFPVILSAIFAIVIGGFSYEILSTTMGLNPFLNVLLATAYVLFPILTAIRGYEFKFGNVIVQPLWVVMVVDMVFTAYHVGFFHVQPDVQTENVQIATIPLHWMLRLVYIGIIPLMQKATNDMLLRVRATYLIKGWLPRVD